MPHEVCQHSGCWLQSFSVSQKITLPLYHLFQVVWVQTYFENDDEEPWTRCDRGMVVGMIYNSPRRAQQGWEYIIRFENREDIPSAPWLLLPHDDEVHEDDLRPIDLVINP